MGDFEKLGLFAPEPLSALHDLSGFTSGRQSLDSWLRDTALLNQRADYTRTFVVADSERRVRGYYALCPGMLLRREAPRAVAPHGAPAELPIALLARLAVNVDLQGQGLGRALLAHALLTVAAASKSIAFRGVVVDALDEEAAAFYRSVGFIPTRIGPLKLILPVQNIVASAAP
jgi:GNAT superfamily N-acetyltransferase